MSSTINGNILSRISPLIHAPSDQNASSTTSARRRRRTAPTGWSLFYARIFLRSGGIIQSIVSHPDQSGVPEGGRRFILSLSAVGEGHVSSLTFRSGSIAADGSVTVDPRARLASTPRVRNRTSGPDGDDVELIFKPDEDISERVIFPVTESQSNGIEDARFVEFHDGGRRRTPPTVARR
jgi:hypothetical protein